MSRLLHWLLRRYLAATRLLTLRHHDALVAYRPCGCLAGVVRVDASEAEILSFGLDAWRGGLTVEPRDGDLDAAPCEEHRR